MLLTTTLFMFGIATLLFLVGKFYFEMNEAGAFMAGFVLIILAILTFTSGIEVKSGEVINGDTVTYIYENVSNLVKVSISGVTLAAGLILFYTGLGDRKKRIEASL